jgi:hypothetical protein
LNNEVKKIVENINFEDIKKWDLSITRREILRSFMRL